MERGPGRSAAIRGHQEIELALVKLYRLTGDRRRLDLAAYFIDERGREPHYFTEEALARGDDPAAYWAKTYEYNQSHIPVREQTRIVGHAVRGMYMASAMADLAFELDDSSLKTACEALWRDVTTAQMYVTAGLGPEESNEGFTKPYDLPNETAYAETCASVALAFWAHRMLHLDLDGRYADVMELALFNGALSGLSREGTHYFYANPLESRGQHRRWAWHLCPCCTMNVSRLVASIGGYAISRSGDGVAIHLYGGFETTLSIGGVKVTLRESGTYPWSGALRIEVDSGGADAIRPQASHSRVDRRGRGESQWRYGSPCAEARLRDDQPALEPRRHRDRPPADASRAPLCPPVRAHGCRTGRRSGAARSSIVSKKPTIPAVRSRLSPCRAARPFSRNGGTICSAGS